MRAEGSCCCSRVCEFQLGSFCPVSHVRSIAVEVFPALRRAILDYEALRIQILILLLYEVHIFLRPEVLSFVFKEKSERI